MKSTQQILISLMASIDRRGPLTTMDEMRITYYHRR